VQGGHVLPVGYVFGNLTNWSDGSVLAIISDRDIRLIKFPGPSNFRAQITALCKEAGKRSRPHSFGRKVGARRAHIKHIADMLRFSNPRLLALLAGLIGSCHAFAPASRIVATHLRHRYSRSGLVSGLRMQEQDSAVLDKVIEQVPQSTPQQSRLSKPNPPKQEENFYVKV
jgi:hypothetical protein